MYERAIVCDYDLVLRLIFDYQEYVIISDSIWEKVVTKKDKKIGRPENNAIKCLSEIKH